MITLKVSTVSEKKTCHVIFIEIPFN